VRRPDSPLSRRVTAAAAVVALVCLLIALAAGLSWALAGLTIVPLAAATFASVRTTAAVAAGTLALVLLAGLARDDFGGGAHIAALIATGLGGAMAVVVAADYARRVRDAAYWRFLGNATTLLTCSLDFDETAKAAASVPVPELADWSLVELFDAGGQVERRTASHADEGAEQVAHALVTSDSEAGRGPAAQLWPELPDELRAGGARAAIRVPLRTPERRLGVMTLIAATPGRRYGETDVTRAEELAARAAMAIENAQLYRAARRRERRFGRRAEPPASGRPEPRTSSDE
jgi:GAF domain-containing protein